LSLLFRFTWLLALAGPRLAHAEDPIITLIGDELKRFQTELSEEPDPPYFMSIGVVDTDRIDVQATHGSASAVRTNRGRRADIDVRIGTPALDNTHKIRDAGWFDSDSRDSVSLPIDDASPRATRMLLWRALDEAYRVAVRRMLKVRNNTAVKVAAQDQSADFSDAPVVNDLTDIPAFEIDSHTWQDTVRAASSLLLDYPAVHDSNVSFQAERVVRRFVSSEGTVVRTPLIHARVSIWAGTTADDGMNLGVTDYVDARTIEGLPSPDDVMAMVRRVGEQITALRKAPLVDPFVGPAILRGRAAAVFFHEVLGHRIEGHRQKDDDEGQTFTDKIGERVLPTFLSVSDDPTVRTIDGVDLSGSYTFDDEGVAAERVKVVENGVLRGFLMSRSPVKGFARSNGHGRRQSGYAVVARQGNLLIESHRPVSEARMREKLIEQIRKQGKPYGYIFDDISGGFTFTGRVTPNAFSVQPVTVWRVSADGSPDELVRGVDLIGTPLTIFQRILAAGKQASVFNGSCGAESGWVPVSAVSPDLLIEEVEIQRSVKAHERPPLLPAPNREVQP
jgi:TldD protein